MEIAFQRQRYKIILSNQTQKRTQNASFSLLPFYSADTTTKLVRALSQISKSRHFFASARGTVSILEIVHKPTIRFNSAPKNDRNTQPNNNTTTPANT